MFDLPDSKRVRREELYSPFPTPSPPSPSLEKALQSKLAAVYDISSPTDAISSQPPSPRQDLSHRSTSRSRSRSPNAVDGNENQQPKSGIQHDEHSHEHAYSFRLFAAPPKSKTIPDPDSQTANAEKPRSQIPPLAPTDPQSRSHPAQTIILRSPTPSPEPHVAGHIAGSILAPRPESYYVAQLPSAAEAARFTAAAVEGTDILAGSRDRKWPGLAMPWRVTHIAISRARIHGHIQALSTTTAASSKTAASPTLKPRVRLNKKRRIAHRQLAVKRNQEALVALEKEKTEREKKTRRNREKKAKQRRKMKAREDEQGQQQQQQEDDEKKDGNE